MPVYAKISEPIEKKQLLGNFRANNIFYDEWSGFCGKHLCETVMVNLYRIGATKMNSR